MSSSAFLIDAAAKTVRVLSSASAGDHVDPNRMTKATKIPERRCIEALHACSRGARHLRAQISVGSDLGATAEAPFRPSLKTYGHTGMSPAGPYQAGRTGKGGGSSNFAYSDGKIAIEIDSSLAPEICSTKGVAPSSYFMVLRMPSQSVAPLKPLGLSR